uniref:Protein kinase domain-containing protein n=1 Tax=Calidris pygmaea TaxID=425635 RepID=A0A8C3KLE4_9CHAR
MVWGGLSDGAGGCLSPKSGNFPLGRKGRGEPGLFPPGEGFGRVHAAGEVGRVSGVPMSPSFGDGPWLSTRSHGWDAGGWWWLLHPSPSLRPRGKFGTVYRLQEKATGKIRAGKYFRTRTAKEKQVARAEVELMNLLHHPRLVQCLAAFQGPAELVMVMEYDVLLLQRR